MANQTAQRNQVTVSQAQWIGMIQNKITSELAEHAKALPAGFNRVRFTMNCITMVQDMVKKDSEKMKPIKPDTIAMCMVKGAYLGLDFFNGECYAIPYGSEMNFQTDYKGEVKLCKKYSVNQIKDIYAKVVRSGDYFEESIDGGVQNISFKPVPFSNAEIIGAFAVVLFKDGSMQYETMSAEEIENIRNGFSKAKNSPAWTKTPGEMYKKTVLRRLCKMIDLNFDTIEAQAAFEAAGDSKFDDVPAVENTAPVDAFAEAHEVEEPQKFQAKPRPQIQAKPRKAISVKQEESGAALPSEQPEAVQAEFAEFENRYSDMEATIDPNAGDLPF